MTIRTLKENDVHEAAAILVACFPLEADFCVYDLRTGFPERWPEGDYDYCENFVAELDGKLVGVSGLYRLTGWPPHLVGVNWMAVLPDNRRRGIGKRLIAEAERRASSLVLKPTTFVVYADPVAVSFYERAGFELANNLKRECGLEEYVGAIFMAKTL